MNRVGPVLGGSTTTELAERAGVSPSAVRHWLRKNAVRSGAGPWRIDEETAARALEHFDSTRSARESRRGRCLVVPCERVSAARGLCRKHYLRWYRAARAGGRRPGRGPAADGG